MRSKAASAIARRPAGPVSRHSFGKSVRQRRTSRAVTAVCGRSFFLFGVEPRDRGLERADVAIGHVLRGGPVPLARDPPLTERVATRDVGILAARATVSAPE